MKVHKQLCNGFKDVIYQRCLAMELAMQVYYFPQHFRKENSWLLKADKSYHFDYSNIHRTAIDYP